MAEQQNGVNETDEIKVRKTSKRDSDYQNRIVTASNRLFKEHGVENVSMHQIAKAAQIGQATLYRRYSNKGEICMAILSSNTQDFLRDLDSFRLSRGLEVTSLTLLSEVVDRIADYLDDQATMLVIIKYEYNRSSELQLLQFNHPVFLYLQDIISLLYAKAIEEREVDPLNVTLTTHTLVAALSPDLFLYQQKTLRFSKEDIVAGIKRIYIEALRK
ncbi:TetR/AcrR family transcriptional regulator [Paenibacillus lutrae]|uniref:TetR family transcriptional regulator n=1 Tax=Paenibacillus lutrae TaxID=2078573 RepID=A0A7X3FEM2_9BACL|nr:TetR/AcrR family transcriptional regulator [Paenibacillus lutrae]MVO98279.1 TetR family transcriptional regulator [Paenibacillus lutrae]